MQWLKFLLAYLFFMVIPLGTRTIVSAQSLPGSCDGMKLTAFKIINAEFPIDSLLKLKTIELSNHQNSFSIGYKVMDSLQPAYYYYKLEGSDKNWIRATNSSVINYTLLTPGTYHFKIKCQNRTAGVSREYIAFRIDINLPFWLNGWFIILSFLAFVGIIYYLHSLTIKRLMAVESVRQKVSRDLHDDIGSTLSTINILSLMAKSKLREDRKSVV